MLMHFKILYTIISCLLLLLKYMSSYLVKTNFHATFEMFEEI